MHDCPLSSRDRDLNSVTKVQINQKKNDIIELESLCALWENGSLNLDG